MSAVLLYMAAVAVFAGAIYLVENNRRTGFYTVAFFFALTGALDLAGLSPLAAATAAFGLLMVVYALSKQKYAYTRFTLMYNDMFGFDRIVFRDIVTIYWKMILAGLAAVAAAVVAIRVVLGFLPSSEMPLVVPLAMTLAGAVGVKMLLPYAIDVQRRWNTDGRHISNFLATMVEQRFLPADFTWIELKPGKAYPGIAAAPPPAARAPHIVVICEESTFPPSLLGLPEEPDVTAFFEPEGVRRDLHVEIFGGQTIVSHMACLTGLSSLVFGDNRCYAPRYWNGRVKVSLPYFLKAHGYSVHSLLSAEHDWMGIGSFYESLGFDSVVSCDSYAPDGAKNLLDSRDNVILEAALGDIGRRIASGDRRTATVLETLRNHGPYRSVKTVDPREIASREWFRERTATLPDGVRREAAEWYGRLRASIDDYNAFRAALARDFPGEEFVIVHYGDHQPLFTARLARASSVGLFRTYVAVDHVGRSPTSPPAAPAVTAVHNIDMLVAAAAGLPPNGFMTAKADLLAYGPEREFGIGSPEYHGIVASLVREGLLVPSNAAAAADL